MVWADTCNGNWDVYEYNLDTGATRQLTSAPYLQAYPRISGERVVWEENSTGVSQV